MAIQHLNITITGKVQGVGFRFSAMEAAYKIGVVGLVKNLNSDQIYIEAEGTEEVMNRFLDWCRKGPLGSKVQKVETTSGPTRNFASFDIIPR
jgi:acylphosphatase